MELDPAKSLSYSCNVVLAVKYVLDPVAHLVRYILTAHDRVCIADKAVCPSGRLA